MINSENGDVWDCIINGHNKLLKFYSTQQQFLFSTTDKNHKKNHKKLK